MKRFMCVWLPNWPVQRLRVGEASGFGEQPLVLFAPGRGKFLVTACSSSIARQGVRPGMPLAEARSLLLSDQGGKRGRDPFAGTARRVLRTKGSRPLFPPAPAVRFELHDRQADREALRHLAGWCQRFSPLVGIEQAEHPDSLLLDITGCEAVFGGEEALTQKVADDFRHHGYWVQVAIAPAIGAAWAVAHYGQGDKETRRQGAESAMVNRQESRSSPCLLVSLSPCLRPLPIEALRLSAEAVRLLGAFDIRRIGQLLALPRPDLAARLGTEVLLRLDQALGNVPEVLIPEPPAEPPLEACRQFEPPLADRKIIERVLEQLVRQLLEKLPLLDAGEKGVQRLLCSLQTAEGPSIRFEVGLLQPSTSVEHLMELVRLRLESTRIPSEVSAVSVSIAAAVPLEFEQGQLFEGDAGADRWKQLPMLIERLSSRLGEASVLRPRLWPDAQPELAWRSEPWLRNKGTRGQGDKGKQRDSMPMGGRSRSLSPCLLVPLSPSSIKAVSIVPGGPPLRFWWKNQSHVIARCWGPQRIETGWWRDRDVRRDYYLAETKDGKRFWLFRRRGDEDWFLQGMYG